MQINAGQYYRTRGGKKAFVAAVENPFQPSSSWPMCGWIDGYQMASEWAIDGRHTPAGESQADLIAEWKEPVTETYWCCLWNDGGVSIHSIKPQPQPLLKAIKQVTITEGEGIS